MAFGIGAAAAAGIQVAGNMIQSNQDYKRNLGMMREAADVQLKNQRIMGYFNKEQQLDLWNKTNYGAQRKHMEKAGLNAGLMYGMGGGGGATAAAASGSASAVSGSHKSNPLDIAGAMVSGAQVENMIAQNELIKAQTEKTEAEAEKIAGADTNESIARTNSLMQDLFEKQITQWERFDMIEAQLKETIANVRIKQAEGAVKTETINADIERAKEEAVGAAIKNSLMKTDISLKGKQMDEIDAKITKMAQDVLQGWERLSIEQQKAKIMQFGEEIKAAYPSLFNVSGRVIDEGLRSIDQILKDVTGKERPYEKQKVE